MNTLERQHIRIRFKLTGIHMDFVGKVYHVQSTQHGGAVGHYRARDGNMVRTYRVPRSKFWKVDMK